MGRVFVAGSINMDVVATADRHPQIGETIAGKRGAVFSRRQGRQPGGSGGQARRADDADRPARHGCIRPRVEGVSRGARHRSRLRAGNAEAHTGTAIITRRQCRQYHRRHSRRQWAGRAPTDVDAAALAKATSPSASSKFRCPRSRAFFKRARAAGATTILNPAPAIEFGAELLDLVDILILNESELGLLARTELRDSDDPARFIEAATILARRRQDRSSA